MQLRESYDAIISSLTHLYGKREAGNIAFLLLSHHLKIERTDLVLNKQMQVSSENWDKITKSLALLKENQPIQYVTGNAYFLDLTFRVDPSVLIPRPETEALTDYVMKLPLKPQTKVLDIGTGSGCIAISIKHYLPSWEVHASDVSSDALKTASKNASLNNVDVTFHHWDINKDCPFNRKFDLIVSNPPYIPPEESATLEPHVSKQEPLIALFTPPGAPLFFYKRIANLSLKILRTNGWIAFETHEDYAGEVYEMLKHLSFNHVYKIKDINGKNRFVFATLQKESFDINQLYV